MADITPDLIDLVENELADAERAAGTYADDPQGWHARHRVEMQALTARLMESVGAHINDRWDGCRVRIGGLTATSTTGISGALRNWLIAARKREERP